ncbi:unnamed protein product, partial [Ectocarpus sp. 12 AP-2014]
VDIQPAACPDRCLQVPAHAWYGVTLQTFRRLTHQGKNSVTSDTSFGIYIYSAEICSLPFSHHPQTQDHTTPHHTASHSSSSILSSVHSPHHITLELFHPLFRTFFCHLCLILLGFAYSAASETSTLPRHNPSPIAREHRHRPRLSWWNQQHTQQH